MTTSSEFEVGQKVHYIGFNGAIPENGIIKSIKDNYAFVVYKCDNNWDNYQDYTGCRTNISELYPNWV